MLRTKLLDKSTDSGFLELELTPLGIERLLKVCDYILNLKDGQYFNFSDLLVHSNEDIYMNGHIRYHCGTTGCFVGYTPFALPELVKLHENYKGRRWGVIDIRYSLQEMGHSMVNRFGRPVDVDDWDVLAAEVFQIPVEVIVKLFVSTLAPDIHDDLPEVPRDASAEDVVALVHKFISIFKPDSYDFHPQL